MARSPSVFVRDLTPEEGRKLQELSRRSTRAATRQRAHILLASATRMSAGKIAELFRTDENQVRRVIHEFNADGMASLRPRIGGGRPRRIDDAARKEIKRIALARPQDLGEPESRWSLRRLRRYLLKHRVVSAISTTHLGRILCDEGVSFQRTRTWKTSNDPLYEHKKNWVLAAYEGAECGHLSVVSFDECGPISLRPHPGRCWARVNRPQRTRATFTRPHGVRYLFGAYDVGADHLVGELSAKKDAQAVLRFLKRTRRRYPEEVTLYVVMDNLSTHWTPDIVAWANANNVGLLPTPTYASYLNRVECHFGAYVEFVVKNSDYPDWQTFEGATRFYIRRRNRDHRPDSPIRQAEHRRKVA